VKRSLRARLVHTLMKALLFPAGSAAIPLVVGIAEILHLQALVLIEGREQETELVLKRIEVGDGEFVRSGASKDKSLGHVTPRPGG